MDLSEVNYCLDMIELSHIYTEYIWGFIIIIAFLLKILHRKSI